MMSELFLLSLNILEGLFLGLFFFLGLYWTVQKFTHSEHIAAWFMLSMLLRTAVVVGSFYFILAEGWGSGAVALVGFIFARLLVTKLSKRHMTSTWRAT